MCDSHHMEKKLTIAFKETAGHEVEVEIESSDPNDDINDIIALLHSTMITLAQGLDDEA